MFPPGATDGVHKHGSANPLNGLCGTVDVTLPSQNRPLRADCFQKTKNKTKSLFSAALIRIPYTHQHEGDRIVYDKWQWRSRE